MIYDDGSEITMLENGTVISRDAGSTVWRDDAQPAPAGYNVFSGDAAEASKLQQFYPESNSTPWWESLAKFGVTKAIDAHFAQPPVTNTSTPGTYAGQNGRTYTQGAAQFGGGGGDNTLLLMGALAAAAFLILS